MLKQKIKKVIKYALAVGGLAVPALASAQNAVSDTLQNSSGLHSLFGVQGLNSSTNLSELILNVIRLMLVFAGAIAIVFVIIGGYYYITSNGNEEQAEKGKTSVINAIIGIVVILLSYAIINVISGLVGSNTP